LAIFRAARDANAIVLTKDSDFVRLLEREGRPPQVALLTCGNTSNSGLREILERSWMTVAAMLTKGEPLVEIAARSMI
jgi:predicted nuclease of predicted toxin-antitoxin system